MYIHRLSLARSDVRKTGGCKVAQEQSPGFAESRQVRQTAMRGNRCLAPGGDFWGGIPRCRAHACLGWCAPHLSQDLADQADQSGRAGATTRDAWSTSLSVEMDCSAWITRGCAAHACALSLAAADTPMATRQRTKICTRRERPHRLEGVRPITGTVLCRCGRLYGLEDGPWPRWA